MHPVDAQPQQAAHRHAPPEERSPERTRHPKRSVNYALIPLRIPLACIGYVHLLPLASIIPVSRYRINAATAHGTLDRLNEPRRKRISRQVKIPPGSGIILRKENHLRPAVVKNIRAG